MDDPMFIPISKLEQTAGKPEEFSEVERNMKEGKKGSKTLNKNGVSVTYFYDRVKDSVYSFAFVLKPSDEVISNSIYFHLSFIPLKVNKQIYRCKQTRS